MVEEESLKSIIEMSKMFNNLDYYISSTYDMYSYEFNDMCAIQLKNILFAYYFKAAGVNMSFELIKPSEAVQYFSNIDYTLEEYYDYISDSMYGISNNMFHLISELSDWKVEISFQYDSPREMYEHLNDTELMNALNELAAEDKRKADLLDYSDEDLIVVSSPRLGKFLNTHDDKTCEYIYKLLRRNFVFDSYWTEVFKTGNMFKPGEDDSLPWNADAFLKTSSALYYTVIPSSDDCCNDCCINFSYETFFICLAIERYMNKIEAKEGDMYDKKEGAG